MRATKIALEPSLRHRRRMTVPPLSGVRRGLLALITLGYTVSLMVMTGVPILDDLWRWGVLLIASLPPLLLTAALTGYASPAACVCFVLLQEKTPLIFTLSTHLNAAATHPIHLLHIPPHHILLTCHDAPLHAVTPHPTHPTTTDATSHPYTTHPNPAPRPLPSSTRRFLFLSQVFWRLSYYPVLLFIPDPLAATIVRTLLLPPLELTLLLIASNRARRHPKVKRLQEWAAFHQCWEAHWWARAPGRKRVRSDDPCWRGEEGRGDTPEDAVIRMAISDAMRRWPME